MWREAHFPASPEARTFEVVRGHHNVIRTIKIPPNRTSTVIKAEVGLKLRVGRYSTVISEIPAEGLPIVLCETSANPPTLPTGKQPEQNLVQVVQEPLPLQQSVGVQVVRATPDPEIAPPEMPPAVRIQKGYRPVSEGGKVLWKKATDSGTGQ